MITLTKLGGKEIMINEDHIQQAQETPDTVLILSGGSTIVVTETLNEITDKVVDFKRKVRGR